MAWGSAIAHGSYGPGFGSRLRHHFFCLSFSNILLDSELFLPVFPVYKSSYLFYTSSICNIFFLYLLTLTLTLTVGSKRQKKMVVRVSRVVEITNGRNMPTCFLRQLVGWSFTSLWIFCIHLFIFQTDNHQLSLKHRVACSRLHMKVHMCLLS